MKPADDAIDVSVLTPSYGYGRFIRDAVESVRGQQGITVEHIVQDAGSTDDTVDVLREYEGDVRWTSEPDDGQSDALNRALRHANGRWVAWLNADEFYFPGGLAALVRTGDRSGADVVYGDAVFVDVEGRMLRLLPEHGPSERTLRWFGPFIPSCGLILRRDRLGTDPWDTDLRVIMDWGLYLELAKRGARFHHEPYPVGAYRVHPGQVSTQPDRRRENLEGSFWRTYGTGRPGTQRDMYKVMGRGLHGLQKIRSRAYERQYRARHFRGVPLRWFDEAVGVAGWNRVLSTCYPNA